MQHENSVHNIENQRLRFREIANEIANEIAALAASVNIKITPYNHESLEHFSKLNDENRQAVLASIEVYLNVYKAVKAEGVSLLDSTRVIWNALTELGYRPTSDLFSYINSGNVIEIHNDRLVQVFRNLVFFDYCSYSLEELYSYEMPSLYSRDIAFETELMGYVGQIYDGEARTVIKLQLKPHMITELASKDKLQITDDMHFIAPLFSSKGGSKPVATLTIESARIESRGDSLAIEKDSAVTPPVFSVAELST